MSTEETDSEKDPQKPWYLRLAAVLVPALATSLVAYMGAGNSAGRQSAEVKDKAESGYQFVREALTELRAANRTMHDDVAKLTVDVADLKRRAPKPPPPSRTKPAPKVAMPPPPALAVPLPADLDKALVQQHAQIKPDGGAGK
jgi:hypothetical protein